MKDFAAAFFLLMFMNQYDVELTEAQKIQMIQNFNAGVKMEVVQIRHEIKAELEK